MHKITLNLNISPIPSRSTLPIINSALLKVNEDGAKFKSYLDGSTHLLTPEKSINVQRNLGADLILVFDECTPYHINK